jgi:hypothetical protein
MRKWKTGTGALSGSLAIGLAGVALVACGDDSDEQARTDEGQQQTSSQGAPDAAAAQRLKTYLKNNAKQLPAGHAKGGQVISFVEVSNGELKIWTFLNSEIAGEEAKAAKVCRVAKESGVPEAKGAVVVDGGGAELHRC